MDRKKPRTKKVVISPNLKQKDQTASSDKNSMYMLAFRLQL